jgi:Uma2 family endonuclease
VIEVAGDSLRKDREVKGALYARFAIPEYWTVNVEAEVVEVSTDPDPAVGAHRRVRTLAKGETLTSETLPQLSLPVRELFA